MARYVILGTGGHATAIKSWLVPGNSGARMTDDDNDVAPDEVVHIGLGDLEKRILLYDRYRKQIPNFGIQIMRGVIIDPSAYLGVNTLLNTGCQIDHDCVIGDHCIISPGAILCGNVTLESKCQIGAGAIILQGVTLESGTKISAGTLVLEYNDLRRPVRVVSARTPTAPISAEDIADFQADRLRSYSDL